MECILVDDCGTDDSIAIVERMISQYKGAMRFRIIHHDFNRGLSAARNTGTLEAKGDYLYYLDSDDEITNDCIETLMIKMAESPDLEMVQGNYCRHNITNKHVVPAREIVDTIVLTNDEVRKCYYQYGQMTISVWNKLVKRDLIIENNILCPEKLLYEETIWTFNLLKYLDKACFISKVTYHYRNRPHSIMTSTDKKTRAYHFSVIFENVLTHLSVGYEEEEFIFFLRRIRSEYFRCKGDVKVFKKVIELCQSLSRLYCSKFTSIIMVYAIELGKLSYGWLIWTLIIRLRHPIMIVRDVRRPFT